MPEKQEQTELATTIHNWLTLAGNKISKSYCKDEIITHPDYPAMTAAIDFLDAGGMNYEAVQADASYIREFNYPLIAHIKQPGNEYMHIVNDLHAWDIQKEITKDWSGIVVFPGKASHWENEENIKSLKKALRQKILFSICCGVGIVAFTLSVYFAPSLLFNLFGLFSVAGVFISVAALGTELGYQSKLVKQVCGTVSNGGCEKVLKSKFAKGIAGITPADMSVVYFTAQFCVYLFACYNPAFYEGITAIATGAILIAAWSIYVQAVKIKEWCALCIGIIALLTLQSVISVFTLLTLDNLFASFFPYIIFYALLVLLLLLFIPVKKLILANKGYKEQLNSLKKWKTDLPLFLILLEKESTCNTDIWKNDLLLGNPKAPVTITVACNPYCGPCAKAHKVLDELMEKYPAKIKVQVRLLCNPNNYSDKRTIAVKSILQKAAEIPGNTQLKKMLTEWFLLMDIDKWAVKWKAKNNIDVSSILLKHDSWMQDANIAFTPTFFVNGNKLPGRYNIEDIEKMIPQLAGVFAG